VVVKSSKEIRRCPNVTWRCVCVCVCERERERERECERVTKVRSGKLEVLLLLFLLFYTVLSCRDYFMLIVFVFS